MPLRFEYQGNVRDKINKGLIKEEKELDKILEINNRYSSLVENKSDNIEEYRRLYNEITNTNLIIKKRVGILNTINNKIKDIDRKNLYGDILPQN